MLSEEGKKVKKELEQFNYTKRRLRILQEELKYWTNLGGAIKAVSGEAVAGGESIPYAERRVIRMEELENMISKAIDDALEQEDQFLKDISALDTLSQNLLMERYMTGKSLQKIMLQFNYSRAQIFRLYDNCFEKISNKHKDETK